MGRWGEGVGKGKGRRCDGVGGVKGRGGGGGDIGMSRGEGYEFF